MNVGVCIAILMAFVSGLLVGLNYRTKKDTDDMLDNFAETEYLRTQNNYLREKLGIPPEEENTVQVVYACDHKACPICANPDCRHTYNVRHARNFKHVYKNMYMEVTDDE